MIEYPTIPNNSKAPREACIAFDKLDGSNVRVKYTQKKGFQLFGSRHELMDESHPHLGQAIEVFNAGFAEPLTKLFKTDPRYRNEKEIVVFGEFYGPNSFAGVHKPEDPKFFTMFDVYLMKKKEFIPPREFLKTFGGLVDIPRVIYDGNLTDQFIRDVIDNKYDVTEGVVCKFLTPTGAACGKVRMAKIKCSNWFTKLAKVLAGVTEDDARTEDLKQELNAS